jgi:hypothetical protein
VIIPRALKHSISLLKHFKVTNLNFIIVKDESFALKVLLLLTYATKMYTIFLPRFQQHHPDLDALPNQDL